jgi:hypothetical protein
MVEVVVVLEWEERRRELLTFDYFGNKMNEWFTLEVLCLY